MFNDPLFRFQTYLSRIYDLGFHDPTDLTPYLNVQEVWEDYSGKGVVIAAIGPVDHLHPELAGNYDQTYLAKYNARAANDLGSIVFPTFFLGIAAADADNDAGIVGVAHEATVRGEWTVAPDAPADVVLTFAFGDPYGTDDALNSFVAAARGGLGNVVLLNSPDVWQSSGDYESGTLHSEFAMNTDRHNITVSGLTAFGYEPHGLGNTHGPMTLLAAPIFTSSYMTTPGGPIPGPNEDTVWNGFGDPLAAPDTTTTLGLDLSGSLGSNTSDDVIGDGWELIAGTWFPELFAKVDSANYTYDASTNAASAVTGGVVALMLEANPNLGWRDVQHILAYSANPLLARPMPNEPANTGTFASVYFDDIQNGAKNWNGGGLWFSAETGFGALDAHGAVRLAETWTGSAASDDEEVVSAAMTNLPTATFPMGDWTDLSDLSDIHKSAPLIREYTVDVSAPLEIEHVALNAELSATLYSFDISPPPVSRFIFTLISPNGTESVVKSASRPFYWEGPDSFTELDWTFTSRAFWGEDTNSGDGEWTIRVELPEFYDNRLDVTIDSLSLDFFGKPADEDDTYIFTEASGLMPLNWTKINDADDWVVRPDTPVLQDASGRNMINAAAIAEDLTLSTKVGATAMADYDPASPIDYQGATEYALYTVGAGTVLHGLIAGDGDDLLIGSEEQGTFNGMRGDDYLRAGSGADVLSGGAGLDRLLGEAGADRFVFKEGLGLDIVYDFALGEDQIGLVGLQFADLIIETYRETGTLIRYEEDRMILRNVDAGGLDAADFVALTEEDLF